MGLEKRGSRFYYYEKRRVGSRVRSHYIGAGQLASMAADIAATAKEEREQQRRERRKMRDEEQKTDQQLNEQSRTVAAVTGGYLRRAGFHQHKGQWRKKRLESK